MNLTAMVEDLQRRVEALERRLAEEEGVAQVEKAIEESFPIVAGNAGIEPESS